MRGKAKSILLCFMLLVIAAPFIQSTFKIFTPGPLFGYFVLAQDTTISIDGWFSGGYQEQKARFVTDHMGFREDLVRVNNQIDLSLFEMLHADAVLGKDHYLYQGTYVDEHYGRNFLGYEYLKNMAVKLKAIQDFFSRQGKTFLIVRPPTKDEIFEDHLPDVPGAKPTLLRNSVVSKRLYDSLAIDYIDLNAVFRKEKALTKEPLFTRQGIHWSIYGSYFATDTIIKWLEAARHQKLPELKIIALEHTWKPRFTDNDLGWPLNLIIPFSRDRYTYPMVRYDTERVAKKPSLVLVGDSFNWTLITNGLTDSVFSKWQFWYYFRNVKNRSNMEAPVDAVNIAGYDWKKALDSSDCLIINYAPHNFNELNSFADSAYNYCMARQDTMNRRRSSSEHGKVARQAPSF